MTFDWLSTFPLWAVLISILLNVIVAITGILPSAFITIYTVGIFRFEYAIIILLIGEAMGAIISFILYRKGANKLLSKPKLSSFKRNKYLQKLRNTEGMTAVCIVLLLRIIPFVPSGAVTLTAALSPMRVIPYSLASTIGKVPAIFIEAYSVYHVFTLQTHYQIMIMMAAILLFFVYLGFKNRKQKK